MRIGLFSYPRLVHGGGFEEYLIAFAHAMRDRGHEVSVVTSSPREYRALNVALNIYYRNPLRYDNSRFTSAELRDRLSGVELHEVGTHRMRRLISSFDVVYAKNELLDLGVLRLLGVGGVTPIICGVHTPMWYPRALTPQARLHNRLYLSRVYKSLLGVVRAVHVSNENDETLFPDRFQWPTDRVFRIPYPYRDVGEPVTKGSAARLRVLFGGRLTQQKGIDVLLDLLDLAAADSEADAFEFKIAGSGEPAAEHELAERTAGRSNVTILGHVERERMPELYAETDVAFVPSNWETFPFACLEPQAAGVPVVASNIPGCRDIVVDRETGFLFTPGRAAEAWSALKTVRRWSVEEPDRLAAMSELAAQRVRREFGPTKIMGELEAMLQAVARK